MSGVNRGVFPPFGNVSGLASSHVGMPERLLIDLLKYTVDSDFAHGSDLAFAFSRWRVF